MVSFHEVAYEVQTSQPRNLSSINMKTITSLAETFLMNPEENLAWLISSSYDFESSKTLFFFMLMQSVMMHNSTFSLHFYFFLQVLKCYSFHVAVAFHIIISGLRCLLF